ncbi:MAG TPA: alpha/beta fold hydrolase [Gaiellaceae bacterium]|nr:alpha/beta fold hydrolase [Gaiellaceae bacterium]
MSWRAVHGRDVRLAARDFGGEGTGALLLHGLAGTAAEWADTAAWLSRSHRVVALDQRGHGRSESRPTDVTPQTFAGDALGTIEEFGLAPSLLVGQSLGGLVAFLAASERPELVRALVVVEATPAEEDPTLPAQIGAYFSSWPVPFASHEAAVEFFGGDSLRARAWAGNLVEEADGLRPAFDVDVLIATMSAAVARDYWDEWRALRVPTLLVRGELGEVGRAAAEQMSAANPCVETVAVPGAGHDVHLDAPEAWRAAVESFLSRLS